MLGRPSHQKKSFNKAEQEKHPSSASYLDFLLLRKGSKNIEFKMPSNNEKIIRVCEILKNTVGSKIPVLITGSKGSGKVFLAKKITELEDFSSQGTHGLVDCKEMKATGKTLMSFLKGAHGDDLENLKTLIFKEVAELSLSQQEEILKILQNISLKSKPRIIVSSSLALENQVQKGLFKQDLYYRLYVLHVQMPCLAERQEDLPLILKDILRQNSREGDFDSFYGDIVSQYEKGKLTWRDNIAGLVNYLEKKMNPKDKEQEETKALCKSAVSQSSEEDKNRRLWLKEIPEAMLLKDLETCYILHVLKSHKNNRTHAAKALGVSLRTLRNKINQYRLDGHEVI